MTTYLARPVEVEAIFFDGENFDAVSNFCGTHRSSGDDWEMPTFCPIGTYIPNDTLGLIGELWVAMANRWLAVPAMTWVIRNEFGHHPVPQDDFGHLYTMKTLVSNPDFPVAGPERFISEDEKVISWKGVNYYQACDALVADLSEGGQSFCVKPVDHPSITHEDFDGRTRDV